MSSSQRPSKEAYLTSYRANRPSLRAALRPPRDHATRQQPPLSSTPHGQQTTSFDLNLSAQPSSNSPPASPTDDETRYHVNSSAVEETGAASATASSTAMANEKRPKTNRFSLESENGYRGKRNLAFDFDDISPTREHGAGRAAATTTGDSTASTRGEDLRAISTTESTNNSQFGRGNPTDLPSSQTFAASSSSATLTARKVSLAESESIVPLRKFYQLADRWDWALMAVGSVAAVANGATFPIFLAIFGSMNGIVATTGAQCVGLVGFVGGGGSSLDADDADEGLAVCNGTSAQDDMGEQAVFICYVGNADVHFDDCCNG